ncbi:hypothetical protein SCP_0112040 [Sparassis crispa]|uniref:Uncharacterized protein n=1 Tax=Sparassis crispa TaxID=139825 RepID=A0A401G845_9APHY|nr:hypothetical protein SCP_0112040 [Sparassis crispa]GBE78319.1 hypothetical protein SCP_0112040 [Sparassis crispa]
MLRFAALQKGRHFKVSHMNWETFFRILVHEEDDMSLASHDMIIGPADYSLKDSAYGLKKHNIKGYRKATPTSCCARGTK